MRYSAFDLQLNKTTKICNKKTSTGVINAIRRLIGTEEDITGLSDEEVFHDWKYALISHKGLVIPNAKLEFNYLKNMNNVCVLFQ